MTLTLYSEGTFLYNKPSSSHLSSYHLSTISLHKIASSFTTKVSKGMERRTWRKHTTQRCVYSIKLFTQTSQLLKRYIVVQICKITVEYTVSYYFATYFFNHFIFYICISTLYVYFLMFLPTFCTHVKYSKRYKLYTYMYIVHGQFFKTQILGLTIYCNLVMKMHLYRWKKYICRSTMNPHPQSSKCLNSVFFSLSQQHPLS